jgi:hypothetical protein
MDPARHKVGWIVADRFQRHQWIGIDASDKSLLLESDRYRRQYVAVVVDEGNHLVHPEFGAPDR